MIVPIECAPYPPTPIFIIGQTKTALGSNPTQEQCKTTQYEQLEQQAGGGCKLYYVSFFLFPFRGNILNWPSNWLSTKHQGRSLNHHHQASMDQWQQPTHIDISTQMSQTTFGSSLQKKSRMWSTLTQGHMKRFDLFGWTTIDLAKSVSLEVTWLRVTKWSKNLFVQAVHGQHTLLCNIRT